MNTIRELMNMFLEGDFQEISLYDVKTNETLFGVCTAICQKNTMIGTFVV